MDMPRVGYNPKRGRIKTDARVTIDRAFVAHVHVAAADAVAAAAGGVAEITLGAEAQSIISGITSPAVPRALTVVSNKANGAGGVVVHGTNYAGEEISETFTLAGTTTQNGSKAFRTVTKVVAPARVNTPAKQVETATVVATVTGAGDAAVTVTSALFDAAAVLAVPVEVDDDSNVVAEAIRAALEVDPVVSAHFDVSGEDAAVVLTAKVAAANDDTLNIAIATGTATGITEAATSANTTAGVAPDVVSVGWGDKLGLPYKLPHDTVLAAYRDNVREDTAPTVAVDEGELEKNTIDLNSALNGTPVDVYLIV
jgi:hypothetical protein